MYYIGYMELDHSNIPEESGPPFLLIQCDHHICCRISRLMEVEDELREERLEEIAKAVCGTPLINLPSPISD